LGAVQYPPDLPTSLFNLFSSFLLVQPVRLQNGYVRIAVAGALVLLGCSARPSPVPVPRVIAAAKVEVPRVEATPVDAGADEGAPVDAAPAQEEEAATVSRYPGRTDGCAEGMVRVEGEYCPLVVAKCLETAAIGTHRCLKYEEPSRCAYPTRDPLDYCIDRFEYPNREGELPLTLVDFHDAQRACAADGKRLCTVDEYNFACEGPDMHPYATGFERDTEACNVDRPFDAVATFRMARHDDCMKDPICAAEMHRLDRRYPIGQRLGCVSWAGVYDLNGNVNEWVRLPEKKQYPWRGGLKGGWWGPVRARCRPTHTTHDEDYWGYELGFRCCKDSDGHPTDISGVSWRPSQSTDR
jgi:hypothetical protein